MYDDLILYDWFSFTAKHHSAESIVDLLGMELSQFKNIKGARGYNERLYFDGISIHFGGREEVWCEMSGQGCRTFESFGNGAWDSLFEETLSTAEYHVTRLDVAFDDHTGIFDLDVLFWDTDEKKHVVSKFDFWEICKSNKGITIYHGSPKSDVRFRIYDKARERQRQDEGHWVRFEMQLRDDKASNFLAKLVFGTIGETFVSVVNNYIRYIKPSGDSNKRRWPMADYWSDFIGKAGRLSLYETPGAEYNLEKLRRFAVDQAGAAAAAYMEIVGADLFMEQTQNKLMMTGNPKYDDLIRKHCEVE